MVTEFFSTIGDVITGLTGAMSDSVNGIVPLFWDATSSKFTIVGLLLIIAVGGGIVYWAFRLIRGLVTRGGSKA